MRTLCIMVTTMLLMSCQKEILLNMPQDPTSNPKQITVPEPPKEEPQQEVALQDIAVMFTTEHHYQVIRHYTDTQDLWAELPEWVKDDVCTFKEMGKGMIDCNSSLNPDKPSAHIEEKWKVYADDEGVKFEWLDTDYNPVTYTITSVVVGRSFVVCLKQNGVKVFSEFSVPGTK